MDNEIWKPIKGYEGRYEVSNMGRVRSSAKSTYNKCGFYYLKGYMVHGYRKVCLLTNDKKKKLVRVARLVAEYFVDGYKEGLQVDHINTIRNDDRAKNLRWCTPKQNSNFDLTIQHRRNSHGKRIAQFTKDGVFVRYWNNACHVKRELGIDTSHIYRCIKGIGKEKTAGGFKWAFV